METATCINESTYSGSLTRGRSYPVLAWGQDKWQVGIRADSGQIRWFPESCFDLLGGGVATLVRVAPEGGVSGDSVEVEVELSDGQRRWCFFVTPEGLSRLCQLQLAPERLLMYAAPHMIVVSAITEVVINQTLHDIDSQTELLRSTLPYSCRIPDLIRPTARPAFGCETRSYSSG